MNKPLIIAYYDGDEEVKVLSNFANTPFELDGVKYYTVEAFWQSLKTEYPMIREKFALLQDGLDAKQLGKYVAKNSQLFTYEGKLYHVGSPEHHILLERAIRAKTAQNMDVISAALTASGTRQFRHMLKNQFGSWREGNSPALPAATFEQMWTTIRQELNEGTFKSTLPLPDGINDF